MDSKIKKQNSKMDNTNDKINTTVKIVGRSSRNRKKKKFVTVSKPDVIIDLTPVFNGEKKVEDLINDLKKDIKTVDSAIDDTVKEETDKVKNKTISLWSKTKKWFKHLKGCF